MLFIASILYLPITIILPTFFFFKQKKDKKDINKLKNLALYLLMILIYLILIIISSFLFNHNIIDLNKSCGNMCKYYTNNYYKVIIALILYIISNVIYYKATKKVLINLFNSKFKYLILITYTIILYCGFILGYYSFYGFLGIFVIKNIIINIFRYTVIFLPLIIYPIDIFIERILK